MKSPIGIALFNQVQSIAGLRAEMRDIDLRHRVVGEKNDNAGGPRFDRASQLQRRHRTAMAARVNGLNAVRRNIVKRLFHKEITTYSRQIGTFK